MPEFREELAKLNAAQLEAVKTTEGPVLVIAGPGTGKTQLLSMRVANILEVTDADPTNVLCLTFTNKAAANMRERLFRLVGPTSHKVTVKTFHGFAAELMGNNPDYFWNGARLSIAPDALQLEVVQGILEKLPLSNPLSIRFAGQFTATDDVLKALRLAKEAGLTPDKLRAIINANVEYIDQIEAQMVEILSATLSAKKLGELEESVSNLPEQPIDKLIAPLISLRTVIIESLQAAIAADDGTGKTKNTGKWKSRFVQTQNGQKGMFDEKRRNNWWLAFADVYEKYREQLHSHGFYDYSDMLLEVIVQLEQNPDFLATVQERYQYVLLDEFQDSNAAQLRLAHLIADHHTAEGSPNLMAVGDDDQSIFGFNGAELNNMLFFDRTYDSVKKIVLTDNYRSSQAILDAAEKIIEQANDRLVKRLPDITKKLIAKNPPATEGEITHIEYQTREHQLSQAARSIQLMRSSSNGSLAVLARGHDSLRQLASILLTLNVPIRYEQQSNILEHDVVKQVMLVARIINSAAAGNTNGCDVYIAQLIRHPAWNIEPMHLWQIAAKNYTSPDWIVSLKTSENENLSQLAEWMMWLANESTYQPLPVIIDRIIGLTTSEHMTSPLRNYFLTKNRQNENYLHGLSAIRLLCNLVNEFSSTPNATLDDFIRFIDINIQNGRGITDESPFVSGENAVELLTVHKAKGLEFDHVFIIDAVEDNWRPRVAGRKPPVNLPLQYPGEQDDDYIRLLYVAATRAKHSLTVTSYGFDSYGNEVLPTPFIKAALPNTEKGKGDLSPAQILEENFRWPRLKPKDERELLRERMSDYQLSATHLIHFLDVTSGGPEEFFERHILRLPGAKTASQSYGTAMHSAMQQAQRLVNDDTFNLDQVIQAYESSLSRQHLAVHEFEKYLEHGRDTLKNIFESMECILPANARSEVKIDAARVGDALLDGIIDRLEINDGYAIITDYKTGAPLSSFTTRDKTKEVKAWRHRSQLIFYALLLKSSSSFPSINSVAGQVIYLEADSIKDFSKTYNPTDDEIERMGRLVNKVWQLIIKLDFPDTAKYTDDLAGILRFEEDLLNGN